MLTWVSSFKGREAACCAGGWPSRQRPLLPLLLFLLLLLPLQLLLVAGGQDLHQLHNVGEMRMAGSHNTRFL